MSLFYFVVEDGTFEHRPERVDLPSLDAARMHAAALSQVLIATSRGRFARGEAWRMRVTDEVGSACFSLQFTAAAQTGGRHSYQAVTADRLCELARDDEGATRTA